MPSLRAATPKAQHATGEKDDTHRNDTYASKASTWRFHASWCEGEVCERTSFQACRRRSLVRMLRAASAKGEFKS